MLTLRGPVTQAEDRAERLDRVLWHIEDNLAGDLSLGRLSAVACWSPEHCQRVFAREFGETPQQRVSRVRLENAANYLMYCPLRSVSEIAEESGFSSAAYFATAFRRHFGVTPQVWKRISYREHNLFWDRPSSWADLPHGSTARGVVESYRRYPQPTRSLTGVEIRHLPAQRLAVLRSGGGYTPAAVRLTWLTLYRWAHSRGLWSGSGARFGVLRSNPLVTDPARCLYYAALPVSDRVEAEGAVRIRIEPENTYAFYRHTVETRALRARDLVSVYLRFYHRWMVEAGMEPFHLRSVEIMPDRLPVLSWRGRTLTLGIPVRPARVWRPA